MNPIINFFSDNFWATCTMLSTITVFIAGYINAFLKTNTIWKQIISWITGIVLTVGGYFSGIVFLNEPVWLTIILTGIIVGLSSNGIYDIPRIKELIINMTKNTVTIYQLNKK